MKRESDYIWKRNTFSLVEESSADFKGPGKHSLYPHCPIRRRLDQLLSMRQVPQGSDTRHGDIALQGMFQSIPASGATWYKSKRPERHRFHTTLPS